MNQSEEVCCFCLESSNIPFIDLYTKCEEGLTQFDKISSTLSQLANMLSENADHNYMVCSECCDTIEMICQFNQKCLNNLKIYLSNKKNDVCGNDNLINIESNINIKNEPLDQENEMFQDSLLMPEEYKDPFSSEAVFIKEEDKEELIEDENLTKVSEEQSPMLLRLLMKNDGKLSKQKQSKTKFDCNFCEKFFSSKKNLNSHLRTHIQKKSFKCNICEKSFIRKEYLKNHLLIHTGEKPHKCDLCDKIFRHRTHLVNHKTIHLKDKPHSCDQCDKRFRRKAYLIMHKRIHQGEKPHKCHVCNKGFTSKSNLNTHIRFHTGEKPFSCNICQMSFGYRSNLVTHKRNNHKN